MSGGVSDEHCLSECELLDIERNQIISTFNMVMPRSYHTIFESENGKIFAVGGRTSFYKLSPTIEVLDSFKDKFRLLGAMRESRLRPRIFQVKRGRILVVDGASDDLHDLLSPEIFESN